MQRRAKNPLKSIPVVTGLVAFGLVGCDQPQQATEDAMRSPEIQNVAPDSREGVLGTQGEENTLERRQTKDEIRTPMEPVEPGQSQAYTATYVNRAVFQVKEPSDSVSSWTRLVTAPASSHELRPEWVNRNSNESIAGMERSN